MHSHPLKVSVLAPCIALAVLGSGLTKADAAAQEQSDPHLAKIEAMLADQARQIAAQNARLTAQDRLIADQQAQLNALRAERATPAEVAAASPAPTGPRQATAAPQSSLTPPPPTAMQETAAGPEQPLSNAPPPTGGASAGETPEETIRPSLLAAIPEGMGVLTPRRRFVFEPSVEYDRFGANSIIFQGVQIIPALPTGPVDSATAAHDVVVATGDFRYGVTDRLEVEARVPFLYRHDRLTMLAAPGAVTQTTDINGSDIGDIELAARYQLNGSREGRPTFVANLLLKTPTGRGPFDLNFDANGAATELATGTGFWGVEPSLTFLLPTDPIVLFANVGYLKNFSRTIDKTIGQVHVGNVDPGDSVDAAFGFGVALNPKFSFSIGYSNSYILGASRELGSLVQHSPDLEVGALTFGWSYRLLSNLLISTNFEYGVTPDAPNLRFTVRLPISF